MKHLHLPLGILLLGVAAQCAHANVWIGSKTGNVFYGTKENWDSTLVPNNTTSTSQNTLHFLIGTYGGTSPGTITAATDNITVTGSDRKGYIFGVGLGKTVNVTINTKLTLSGAETATSVFGTSGLTGSTGTGASTTHFIRLASAINYQAVEMGTWIVGYDLASQSGGHSLNFTGMLNVSDVGTRSSILGFRGNDNELNIENQAQVTRYGLDISSTGSLRGNTATVTGAGSALNTLHQLHIGSSDFSGASTDQGRYDGGARLNGVIISDGASSTLGTLAIGKAVNARSNYLHIEGVDSLVTVNGKSEIGSASSLGGNEITVSQGGRLTANGTITITGFNANGGINDGANRLTLAAGGTLVSDEQINVSGLLQLAEGGSLEAVDTGLAIAIKAGGRFEAEGNGIGSLVSTVLENHGTLAIGVGENGTSASLLQLNSGVQSNGGTLELTAWSGTSIDQIEFLADGWLGGTITLTIQPEGFVISEGDSWTVFTGETSGISATFDFSQLGFAVDSSSFNETGGWRLTVIPEPSTYVMLGTALLLLLAVRARQMKRS